MRDGRAAERNYQPGENPPHSAEQPNSAVVFLRFRQIAKAHHVTAADSHDAAEAIAEHQPKEGIKSVIDCFAQSRVLE